MSNCIKSRYEKCPLKDNCFDLVDDSEDCKCRLEDYQKGRADAIEQILDQMIAYREAHYYSFANYDVQKYADGFKNATNTLISMVEQLKEKKNE